MWGIDFSVGTKFVGGLFVLILMSVAVHDFTTGFVLISNYFVSKPEKLCCLDSV